MMNRAMTIFCSMMLVSSATALADGASDYGTYCATCHGTAGAGDGPVAAGINPKPADFTSAEFWASRDDAKLKKAILEGGAAVGKSPMMPPQAGVIKTDAQFDSLLAYLKTFKK